MEKLLTNLKTYFYPNVIKIVAADHSLKILITLSFWRHFGKMEVRFYRIKQNFKKISQAYTGSPSSNLCWPRINIYFEFKIWLANMYSEERDYHEERKRRSDGKLKRDVHILPKPWGGGCRLSCLCCFKNPVRIHNHNVILESCLQYCFLHFV